MLGPHRLGTTFLHQLLADSGAVEYISYYDIVEFSRRLFNFHNDPQQQVIERIQKQLDLGGPMRKIDSSSGTALVHRYLINRRHEILSRLFLKLL